MVAMSGSGEPPEAGAAGTAGTAGAIATAGAAATAGATSNPFLELLVREAPAAELEQPVAAARAAGAPAEQVAALERDRQVALRVRAVLGRFSPAGGPAGVDLDRHHALVVAARPRQPWRSLPSWGWCSVAR